MTSVLNRPCPCGSGKKYKKCCKRYHDGLSLPENALLLMKSRYAAYAVGQLDYIIATTDPSGDVPDRDSIDTFSRSTEFCRLEIIAFEDGKEQATVTFKAHLTRDGKDVSFQEKSLFRKSSDRWLYVEALKS